MDFEVIYENVSRRNMEVSTGLQRLNRMQIDGKERKQRERRCLLLVTVSLGLICVLLLIFIIWLNITITAEREEHKNTVQEFNHTINSIQNKYNDLRTEKDRLMKKNLELERNVTSLGEDLQKELSKKGCFFISKEKMGWSESRQFCRDRGADLVIIKTEEKQRHISSFIKESMWIGLSDMHIEGSMEWVDNSSLTNGFWAQGEPNNYHGSNEDCVELNPARGTWDNWNDLPCSQTRKEICEK